MERSGKFEGSLFSLQGFAKREREAERDMLNRESFSFTDSACSLLGTLREKRVSTKWFFSSSDVLASFAFFSIADDDGV